MGIPFPRLPVRIIAFVRIIDLCISRIYRERYVYVIALHVEVQIGHNVFTGILHAFTLCTHVVLIPCNTLHFLV